jgi:tRNA(Ile2) C34 agmatinyltransferase TiaS
MSSMTRTIRRQIQRNRLNTTARRLCPDCGSVLKANSINAYTCKNCQERFKRSKSKEKKQA